VSCPGVLGQTYGPGSAADELDGEPQQEATDASSIVVGIHVQPRDVHVIDTDETDDFLPKTGNELAGAAKTLGVTPFRGERHEGTRVTTTGELVRSRPIVNDTDGWPVALAICSDNDLSIPGSVTMQSSGAVHGGHGRIVLATGAAQRSG